MLYFVFPASCYVTCTFPRCYIIYIIKQLHNVQLNCVLWGWYFFKIYFLEENSNCMNIQQRYRFLTSLEVRKETGRDEYVYKHGINV